MLSYLSRATLDIIGLAGFNYAFNGLSGGSSELSEAFNKVFDSTGMPVMQLLRGWIPVLRYVNFDSQSRHNIKAQKTIRKVGMKLVAEKKKLVMEERASRGGTELEKGRERDLLTLLIKANMSTALGKEQTMSDDEVINQIPTFLIAGGCILRIAVYMLNFY